MPGRTRHGAPRSPASVDRRALDSRQAASYAPVVPNLVGVVDPTASPEALAAARDRMLQAVDLPGIPLFRRTAEGRGLAAGNLLTGVEPNLSQPARDTSGVWLMLDGEAWNAPELAHELRLDGGARVPADDAETALAAYLRYGLQFGRHLTGQWNALVHDPRTRTTHIITDRHGSRLLYAAFDGPRTVVASEAKAVIAGRSVPTRPGGLGLVQQMCGDAHFGDLTWLEGISVLDNGTIYSVDEHGRVSRERYRRLRFHDGAPTMSEDDAVEALRAALATAVHRAFRDPSKAPVVLTLSGGLDSRTLLLSARSRQPFPTLTYGDPESADVRYAAMLASVTGSQHHYVEAERARLEAEACAVLDGLMGPAERGFYGAQLDRIAWRVEGMSSLTGAASMSWHPYYATMLRAVINGAAGDALSGSHLTPELMLGPTRRAVAASLSRSVMTQGPELVSRVLQPAYARRIPEVRAAIDTVVDGIDADDAVGVASVWDLENRQRRGAFSTFTVERYFATTRAPFLDDAVTDVFASLPPLWRFQQRLYKRMIVRAFPEAKHVPWAYHQGRITDRPAFEFAREVFGFAKSRLTAMLPHEGPQQTRWAFRDVDGLLRHDPSFVRGIIAWTEGDQFLPDIFDGAGVRALAEDFAAGRAPPHSNNILEHIAVIARFYRWGVLGGSGDIRVPPEADPARFGVKPIAIADAVRRD